MRRILRSDYRRHRGHGRGRGRELIDSRIVIKNRAIEAGWLVRCLRRIHALVRNSEVIWQRPAAQFLRARARSDDAAGAISDHHDIRSSETWNGC
jgi:hypothetical protein